MLGDLGDLIASCASCSKKSDQSSARDSFLVPPSGKKSVDKAGVLGVLFHGDKGTRRLEFDAPGRLRPACSRCSTLVRQSNRASGRNSRSYHLSRLVNWQLFATLETSLDQLFPEPENGGNG